MKNARSHIGLFGLLFILIVASACKRDEIQPNEAPVIDNQSFSVAETIDDEAIIGMVQASDPDRDALSFSITETVELNDSRDFTGLFEIDETTGALSLTAGESLDYEDASGFSVTVSVSDEELTAKASITINVTDVNRAPVVADQSFSVVENTADVWVIGIVEASDPDGDAISFSITETVELDGSRDFTGLFEIDEATGALSLADGESLDYEVATGFAITVSVSDTELTTTASVTIMVTDIDDSSFITTWRTTTANQTIGFGTIDSLTYNYNVDWGDGTIETNITGSPTHSYATPGDYQIAITGTFPAILTGGRAIVSIDQWGDIEWKTMTRAFASTVQVVENASDAPDLSQVTSMAGMFSNCLNFNGDLNNWDVSNITDMSDMFNEAPAFNGAIGNWDVSNVTDMSQMFRMQYSFHSRFNQYIGDWDVSNVRNMSGMFYGAGNFNQDIGDWDVSSVTDMSRMFESADFFNQDIGGWDVGSVTDMSRMFQGASAFNQDIGNWDVSKVTDMRGMFNRASVFNQNIGDWNVSQVTGMNGMFYGADAFNQDIGNWDVSNVTNMNSMFRKPFNHFKPDDPYAFNQDIGRWDVSNVTSMENMFDGALAFNQDIGSWDVSNVIDMSGMFFNARVFNQNIGRWDVRKVQTMDGMFGNALAFNQDIGGWDVSSVTRISGMFGNALAFNQDIGSWDVSNVTWMIYMFSGAEAFNQDIGGWDVSNVTWMDYMFEGASAFDQDIGNWDVSNVTQMVSMFAEAFAFDQDLTLWDVANVYNCHEFSRNSGLAAPNHPNFTNCNPN